MRSTPSHPLCCAILALLVYTIGTSVPAFSADEPNQYAVDPEFIHQGEKLAPASSTGVPIQFTVDPATIRQGEKENGAAVATVILKTPSPTFFVCQIRSSEKEKINFSNIIFKKGQLQGTSQGTIYWPRILKDTNIKISAFSVDAPGDKLWFTVTLKVKDEDEDNADKDNPPNGEAAPGP